MSRSDVRELIRDRGKERKQMETRKGVVMLGGEVGHVFLTLKCRGDCLRTIEKNSR